MLDSKNVNTIVYAVRCSEECSALTIGETRKPLHKGISQHRRSTTTGQDSAGHLHLKENSLLRMPIFTFWTYEGSVREAIYCTATVNNHH